MVEVDSRDDHVEVITTDQSDLGQHHSNSVSAPNPNLTIATVITILARV